MAFTFGGGQNTQTGANNSGNVGNSKVTMSFCISRRSRIDDLNNYGVLIYY